ncbi:Orn/Lys/Arg decarboxylase N-terminal domain-containing protein [Lentisphaerota bacterium ZTH]|nr:lysine decarboxylase [Lentisphaerota bacterium]WET06731.1 Orn/Lys/Arg decarboxylase N-terminal domain-containing protein [Lentisphaerota bacterium ZTH]
MKRHDGKRNPHMAADLSDVSGYTSALLVPERSVLSISDFPALIVSGETGCISLDSSLMLQLQDHLQDLDISAILSSSVDDAFNIFKARKDLSCVVMDWDNLNAKQRNAFAVRIRAVNAEIPLFLLTREVDVDEIKDRTLISLTEYVWTSEDSISFIAGTIKTEVERYCHELLPPLFKSLVEYVNKYKYDWAVPGHSGGSAFLRSPVGTAFFKFYGENIFRSDINTTCRPVGSVLEHSSAVGESEKQAAEVFGADLTYYVINGTSTSNKIIFHAFVCDDDIVLIDRNCHKSIMHGIIMTRSRPVYLRPVRNSHGIIGPIPLKEFERLTVEKCVKESPLIDSKNGIPEITMAVVTNSTYDGLCYNVPKIKDKIEDFVRYLFFDEAWYAYARFFPSIYGPYYGMSNAGLKLSHPPVFVSQSTHKLLAAFSQGSMVHIKHGSKRKIDPDRFNEAFMMHTTTSPFDPLLASLDVSSRMMKGAHGKVIMRDIIMEAIEFRKKMAELFKRKQSEKKGWFFSVWQPKEIEGVPFEDIPDHKLISSPNCWRLRPEDEWHGFKELDHDYMILDPIKVTVVSPGINMDGSMPESGVPASVITSFLEEAGVLVEKVNYYSFLILFSPGVTNGKSGTTIARLLRFERLHRHNSPISEAMPGLAAKYPAVYEKTGLRDLCTRMHNYFKAANLVDLMSDMYDVLPQPCMTPAAAYQELIRGTVEYVPLDNLEGRISAVMVVPYPPGIPVIMPGEKFTGESNLIIDYLKLCENYDNDFPGFENHIHGIARFEEQGRNVYKVSCVKHKN